MFYFCTYFDSHYLLKGLALYRSLVRHAKPFRFWVLCFDDLVYETLQKLSLPEIIPISLKDFEEGDEELLRAKSERSRVEYYFTCTPSLPRYILRNYPRVDVITYVDADLFFFSGPSPIYEELGDRSILIIGHRFPSYLKDLERCGLYNVGLLSFRRDSAGLQSLNWWRERCLQWCHDSVEDGRFADQKYLDDWPTRFPKVVVLQHKGADLAPWNLANHSLSLENGQVLVDSQPLVFFHFQSLRRIGWWLYDPNLEANGVRAGSLLKARIYGPYIREIQETRLWVSSVVGRSHIHMDSIRGGNPKVTAGSYILGRMARKIKSGLLAPKRILQGYLLLVIGKKVV